MDPPPVLGLTLAFFHRFVDVHGGRGCLHGLTTLDVCERFVKPYTTTSQLSLVDHVLSQPRGHEYAKPAQWLISHSWSYQFLDVVDAIDGFCHEQELSPDTTSFWFCLFANNQHTIGRPAAMFALYLQSFRSALESTGQLVMVMSPWYDPDTLKRTWCVYEVYLSIVLNARFEVAVGSTQKAEFLTDIKEPDSVLRMLGQINSSNSITTEPSDRDHTFQLIEDQVGFVQLDRMVFDVLQGWIMRSLDKQIELATCAEDLFEWTFTKAMRLFDEEELCKARVSLQSCEDIFKTSLSPTFWQGWEAQLYLGASYARDRLGRELWESICDEALSKLHSLVGRDEPAVCRAVLEVGDAYCWNKHFDRGMPLLVEALELAEEFHGADEILDAKQRLGMYLTNHRKLTQAEAMLRFAYDGLCQLHGPSHKCTVISRDNLAVCHVVQGRYREAEALMAWNVNELQRTRGETHPDILPTTLNLGVVQGMLGNYDDAERNLRTSMQDYERDGKHLSALHGQRHLGFLMFRQGNLVEAKTCLASVHATLLESYPPSFTSCRNILSDRYVVDFELGSEFESIEQIQAFEQLLEAATTTTETWRNYPCHKCHLAIAGDLAICKQCPRHSVMFCKGCLTVPNAPLVCGHNDGPWDTIPPATRYLRERKALLLAQSRLTAQQGEVMIEPTGV